MKKIILALFLLFVFNNIFSQKQTFEYLLSTPQDEIFTDIIETLDNNIYLTGRVANKQYPFRRNGIVIKLDMFGNMIDSSIVQYFDKSISFHKIFVNNNEELIIVSKIFDSLYSYKNMGISLIRMDSFLNLIEKRHYSFPPLYKAFHLTAFLETTENVTVSGAIYNENNNINPFLFMFNNTFDSIQGKFFTNKIGCFSNIKPLTNNNYWVINWLTNKYTILDSSLNIVAEQRAPHSLTSNFGVVWDTDTSFYLLGDDILPYSSTHTLGFIRQFHPMDTTGNIYNQWRVSDTIDFPAYWGGIDFKNKDSIFIGGTRDMGASYYDRWPSWFVILQTDSLLNIRWERFYGGDAFYSMGKLIATNDGGCIVAGTRYDYMNTTEREADIIVLKLNGDGLITSNQGKPSIEMHEAIVYPNPGNAEISVRIAVQYKHSVFELFDINGRHILKQNFTGTQGTVNTTFLEHGTYIYRITSNDGLFETGKWIKQ